MRSSSLKADFSLFQRPQILRKSPIFLPDARRQGVGRALVVAGEAWARSRGCLQMASDAELWNTVSHEAHGALGYPETARLVHSAKALEIVNRLA